MFGRKNYAELERKFSRTGSAEPGGRRLLPSGTCGSPTSVTLT